MNAERKALFMCAAHCQGGHSAAGAAAAEALGVPFPISMGPLVTAARREGANPVELWPWLLTTQRLGGTRYFTDAEIAAARAAAVP